MKHPLLILSIITITSCSQNIKVNQDSVRVSSNPSDHKTITWIQNNLTPMHALKGQTIRKTIPELMSKYKIPGVSMVFIEEGKIAWKKTYGYANLETSEKVTDETVFTGASFSKPLTAVAALNLVETKKLSLDNNVNTTLKGWQVPENEFTNAAKVTLRHLLSHRAGIKNDLWNSYLPKQKAPSLLQLLSGQAPSTDPATSVIAIPGSVERYSNTGYSVIQKLIEDVTDQKFEHVLDEFVLEPSGMKASSFQQPIPNNLQNKRAVGYDENLNPFPYKIFPYKAAGGVWTTPSDIASFIITLLNDYDGQQKLLSQSMMKNIFSRNPVRLAFAKIYGDDSDDLIFRHYGTNQGFSSYLVGSIQKRQAFVIMTNGHMEFEFLDYVARAVAEFYQWDYLKPSIHIPYQSTNSDLQNFTGQFKLNEKKLSFVINDGKLLVEPNSSEKKKTLVQIGPGEFISTDDSVKYQFLKARENSDGTFIWLRVTSPGGSENFAERIST